MCSFIMGIKGITRHISRNCCKFVINLEPYASFPKNTVYYTTSQLTKHTSKLKKNTKKVAVA
jgi:hypothetical protein